MYREYRCVADESIIIFTLESSVSDDYMKEWNNFCNIFNTNTTKQTEIFTEWKYYSKLDSNKRLRTNSKSLEVFLDESKCISLISPEQSGEIRMKIHNGKEKWYYLEIKDLLDAFVKTCNIHTHNFLCKGNIIFK